VQAHGVGVETPGVHGFAREASRMQAQRRGLRPAEGETEERCVSGG